MEWSLKKEDNSNQEKRRQKKKTVWEEEKLMSETGVIKGVKGLCVCVCV